MDTQFTASLYRHVDAAGRRGYLIVGLLAAVQYALTAGPGLYWRDSGELAAAGISLGIGHPTGFPLYLMFVKAVSFVPLGSLAFRANLASAICGAITVGVVYKVTEEILAAGQVPRSLRQVGAFIASGLLAVVIGFWRSSTVAEVYAPSAALLVIGLLLFWRSIVQPDPRRGLALSLVAGLCAVGIHGMLRWEFVVPWAVLWLWYLMRSRATWPRVAPVFFVIGMAVLAYLPVVSGRTPLMDWGHPHTAAALWGHLAATRIRHAFAGQMLTTNTTWVWFHFKMFTAQLWDQLLGPAPILLLVGIFAMVAHRHNRSRRPVVLMAALLVWIAVTDYVYAFRVNPMGIEDLQNGTGLLVAGAILTGVGLVSTARFLAQSLHGLAVTASIILVVITVAPPAASQWKEKVAGADWGASVWNRAASEQPVPGGVMLVVSDDLAAGQSYLHVVEDARPDVVVLVRQHLWDVVGDKRVVIHADRHGWLLSLVEEYATGTAKARVAGRLDFLRALVDHVGLRPVYWEPGDEKDVYVAAGRLRPAVPLFEVLPPTLGTTVPIIERVAAILGGQPGLMSRRVAARHLTAVGRLAYRRALVDRTRMDAWLANAVMLYHAALKRRLRHVPALVDMGAALALQADRLWAKGDRQRAKILLGRALSVTNMALEDEPLRGPALVNCARYEVRLARWLHDPSRLSRAVERLTLALKVGYNGPTVTFLLGVISARRGHYRKAASWFERTLKAEPGNEAARTYLNKVRSL